MFDWNLCDTAEDIHEELCHGVSLFSRDSRLTWLSALIYEDGFTFEEIAERIEKIDGAVYGYEVSDEDDKA